jgi:hypothetical protein
MTRITNNFKAVQIIVFLFIIHNTTRSAVLLASQSATAEFKYLANYATL